MYALAVPARDPRPDLVVFDLGGVLVRVARSWAEACALAGLDWRGDFDDAAARAAREPLVVAYETGRLDRLEYCERLSRATGARYTPQEVGRIHDAWLIEEFPGLARIFDALEAAGVPTAILSNTNAAHWEAQFPASGASGRFPTLARVRHPHASHLLGLRKPDPEVYPVLERAVGGARRVVFFDDLERNVIAARRAGWDALLVDPLADPAAQVLAALESRVAWVAGR
jgi:FMN phosphatase YigB (HAD superfamily)